jgi:hypothetical protein
MSIAKKLKFKISSACLGDRLADRDSRQPTNLNLRCEMEVCDGISGSELASRAVDPVKQQFHLRGVADILIRHDEGDDIPGSGIRCQLNFSPVPTGFDAMLLREALVAGWPDGLRVA